MLNDLRARVDKVGIGLIDNDYPWDALKREFLQWAKQAVSDAAKYEADLLRFESFASPRNIREIDVPLVVSYREHLLAQPIRANSTKLLSPRTVNRQVGTLKNMLSKGVEWARIGTNDIARLKPLPNLSPRKVRRSMTLEEVQAFLDASPAYLMPVWLTFMTTGMRRSELVELLFSDVDVRRRTITINAKNAKNGQAREVPLDDATFEIIRELKKSAGNRAPVPGSTAKQTQQQAEQFSREHVFVTQANTPLRNNLLARFYAICKKAGIDDGQSGGSIDIHALRVSFITLALEHGSNPKAVQAIVGHGSLEMTMNVYAKATDKSKLAVIAALPFAQIDSERRRILDHDAHKLRTNSSEKPQVVAV